MSDSPATSLRALHIVECIARAGRFLSAREIGVEVNLPKPTVHRLCTRLVEAGFLIRGLDSGLFGPSGRSRALANGLLQVDRLDITRRRIIGQVSSSLGETCNLAVPDDQGMVYIERVETRWPLRFTLPIGTAVPFHCTASGKLFLSSLPEAQMCALLADYDMSPQAKNTITTVAAMQTERARIIERGFSIDNEEYMDGLFAFAMAIRDPQGRFAAALGVQAPTQRLSEPQARRSIEILQRGCRALEKVLFTEIPAR